jgi:hypothetical protein
MAIIKKNMADVPDEIPPLDADTYVFNIIKADVEEVDANDQWNPGKNQLVLQLQVDQPEHKNHGRMQFDRITLDTDRGDVQFKKLIKAAGLIPGAEFDTDSLVNCRVKATVKNRAGKGENSGKLYANIGEYLY